MNWYKKITAQSNIFYHGANCNIDRFSMDFIGSGKGYDQQGPGVYFTTDIANARRYGPCVHKVQLIPTGKVLTDRSGSKMPRGDIQSIVKGGQIGDISKLVDMDQNERLNTHLSNYHENPKIAFKQMIDSILQTNSNSKDMAQSIAVQAYRGRQRQFIDQMKAHGYSMLLVDKQAMDGGKIKHAIVYDTSIIKYLGMVDNLESW